MASMRVDSRPVSGNRKGCPYVVAHVVLVIGAFAGLFYLAGLNQTKTQPI